MYKIVGGDRQEYGPVPLEAVRQWIAQGRANGQTLASFESGPWKPLASFPELANDLQAIAPPPLRQFQGVPPAGQRTNGLAIAGLSFGLLGLLCCGPFGGILAIIFSTIAAVQMSRSPNLYSTPKVVPWLGIGLGIFDLLLSIYLYRSGAVERLLEELQRR